MSTSPVTGPHCVPNLRLYLLDRWRVGGVLEDAAQVVFKAIRPANPYSWRPREEAEWQRLHLGDPDLVLWWIGAEMVDEISHVASELPDDARPTDVPGLVAEERDEGLVATRGLVIMEQPVLGLDSQHPDHQILVDGFLYGGTKLPPIHGRGWRDSVSVSAYRRVNFDQGLDDDGLEAFVAVAGAEREKLGRHPGGHDLGDGSSALHGEEWLPLGRSDWPFIDRLRDPVDPTVTTQAHLSMAEDRKWLAALHLVAEDHRVAEVKRVEPSQKHLRRPSERRKLGASVRVVYLRQLEGAREVVGRESEGRRRAPRAHIVRSHPRFQPYGPDRSLRRLILIPRHVRGHGGGPPEEGPPKVRAIIT